ncbi:MAG: hypothetical protein WBX37_09645, partial [Pseudolabrys sp.]
QGVGGGLSVRRQSLAKAIAPQPSGARRRGDQAAEVNVTKQPDGVQLFTPALPPVWPCLRPQIGWPLSDLPSLTGADPEWRRYFARRYVTLALPPIDGVGLKYVTVVGTTSDRSSAGYFSI